MFSCYWSIQKNATIYSYGNTSDGWFHLTMTWIHIFSYLYAIHPANHCCNQTQKLLLSSFPYWCLIIILILVVSCGAPGGLNVAKSCTGWSMLMNVNVVSLCSFHVHLLALVSKTNNLQKIPFIWHVMNSEDYEKQVKAKGEVKKFDFIHMIQVLFGHLAQKWCDDENDRGLNMWCVDKLSPCCSTSEVDVSKQLLECQQLFFFSSTLL